MNNLAATLNAEKETIGDALDAVGPAIDVLADQHDELIDMLGALEELGRVGTRVINASKEDILKMLDHLYPVLDKLHEAGHALGPGLNLLVSFPFPKAANDIVQGDYADTIDDVSTSTSTTCSRASGSPTSSSRPRRGPQRSRSGACAAAA